LASSTLLTLIVIPVLYHVVEGWKLRFVPEAAETAEGDPLPTQ